MFMAPFPITLNFGMHGNLTLACVIMISICEYPVLGMDLQASKVLSCEQSFNKHNNQS